jgi:hypothetical protein
VSKLLRITGNSMAFCALCAASAAVPAAPAEHDVVIRNAVIYDGSGRKPYAGEVAIDADRITYVGPPRVSTGRARSMHTVRRSRRASST